MEQKRSLADDRLVVGCIYCGGYADTNEHVPSKVFLDKPYPENLPIVRACADCNRTFSLDEEYVACLIESLIAGTIDPDHIQRESIANILRRKDSLRTRIEAGRRIQDGRVFFDVERARVTNIVVRLARGHSAFELSRVCREEPRSVVWSPLELLKDDERDSFDEAHFTVMLGEIGSRSQQSLLVIQPGPLVNGEDPRQGFVMNDWIEVQEDKYRFLAIDDVGGIRIRMVIAEYFAAEVAW